MAASRVTSTVEDTVTMREFLKALRKSIWVKALTKLSKDRPLMVKSQEKGLLMMSRFSFRELMTTMMKGNM